MVSGRVRVVIPGSYWQLAKLELCKSHYIKIFLLLKVLLFFINVFKQIGNKTCEIRNENMLDFYMNYERLVQRRRK